MLNWIAMGTPFASARWPYLQHTGPCQPGGEGWQSHSRQQMGHCPAERAMARMSHVPIRLYRIWHTKVPKMAMPDT